MKVKFFIVKGKSEYNQIHMRFWDSNRIDQKSKTGLIIPNIYWSETKEKVKLNSIYSQKDFVNENLRKLQDYVTESYLVDYNSKVYISNKWLNEKIEQFFGRVNRRDELHKIYFVDWIQKFIDEAPKILYKGKPIANRTIQFYKTCKKKIESFEKKDNVKLRFEDIDIQFYRNFIFYCRNEEKLNDNTIGGVINFIKKCCRNIDVEGLPISSHYKHSEFMTLTAKTKDIYLNEEQIKQIYDLELSSNSRLGNVRDLFIFGLRTGLRISDFMRLKNININEGFIEIETKKTGEPVVIPLHKNIKEILLKRKNQLPKTISDQKFNKYIKEVCQMAKLEQLVEGAKMDKITKRKKTGIYPIYELVSSHTCRRSFASNLYGKLPNMTIMAITGHKTETVFLKYIKITNKEHALKLQKLWKE